MPAAPIHYASEPQAIGDHLWRVIVTDSRFGGRRFVYQFAPVGELPIWREMTEWPAFSLAAPGVGLPPALATLYQANKPAILAALVLPEPESLAALLWA